MNVDQKKFCFSIDRGGTFTDIFAQLPGQKNTKVMKLLSEDPSNYKDAPTEGIRRILLEHGINLKDGLVDGRHIEWVRMGTTVATNALLERKGAKTALMITKGFEDLLEIGDQSRSDLFRLDIQQRKNLYQIVIGVDERIIPHLPYTFVEDDKLVTGLSGRNYHLIEQPEEKIIKNRLQNLKNEGIESIALVLMHAYDYAQHEEMIGNWCREIGFEQISLSSHLMKQIKIVHRGQTSVVDAYLTPHIQGYLNKFLSGFYGLDQEKVLFMQSNGSLTSGKLFRGANSILSGPAGGVVGFGESHWSSEESQAIIGFDMGGTSTDVSRYAGSLELNFESVLDGINIQIPQLDIKTVAAGGGSRLFFENGMFRVGPESAGSHPGPICYRKNGFLTITDANLILGRIQVDFFPKIFGPEENLPLDYDGAYQAFENFSKEINEGLLTPLSVEEVALGFLKVANQAMARPIKEVSEAKGYDIREHILAPFGGAGGQHACALASVLGINKIVLGQYSGVLSAFGLSLAQVGTEYQQNLSKSFQQIDQNELDKLFTIVKKECENRMEMQSLNQESFEHSYFVHLRLDGTNSNFVVEGKELGKILKDFKEVYFLEFGFVPTIESLMIDSLRVDVKVRKKTSSRNVFSVCASKGESETRSIYFDNGFIDTPLYQFDSIELGRAIQGPALIMQETSTILIEPEYVGQKNSEGDLEIVKKSVKEKKLNLKFDPIQLSIFSNLFMSIAEQMGKALQRMAKSTNMKERLDYSCAIFDSNGNLIANAPHVPVHLGAMGEAIKSQLKLVDALQPGDVLVSNHPEHGGSHLPDITVMTPYFGGKELDKPLFWVANRGHHSDVGGITPGSMPPFSKNLSEEGVAISSFKIVSQGEFQESPLKKILFAESSPEIVGVRNVEDNISDLKAQVAANHKGIQLINDMMSSYGKEIVLKYMQYLQNTAEKAVRQKLMQLVKQHKKSEFVAEDEMDDGTKISLKIQIDEKTGECTFDFTGTGINPGSNLHTPLAVTKSAILYCLRCLVKQDIPLNQGCLNPIKIKIPSNSLLNPIHGSAVVGGNVLTSQRIVDVILKAFEASAASQGCMNNFTFGNEEFGYYETIGGGAGAGPGWDGASGVHTHMTNTKITDPEVLEVRYPVQLKEFSLRKHSGGTGKYRGGDGLIRRIKFLKPLDVSILSERREKSPFGLHGGKSGLKGVNTYISSNGSEEKLKAKVNLIVGIDDEIEIQTPGGGGWGR